MAYQIEYAYTCHIGKIRNNNEDNFLFKVGEREYIICKDISLHTIIKNIFDKIEEIL